MKAGVRARRHVRGVPGGPANERGRGDCVRARRSRDWGGAIWRFMRVHAAFIAVRAVGWQIFSALSVWRAARCGRDVASRERPARSRARGTARPAAGRVLPQPTLGRHMRGAAAESACFRRLYGALVRRAPAAPPRAPDSGRKEARPFLSFPGPRKRRAIPRAAPRRALAPRTSRAPPADRRLAPPIQTLARSLHLSVCGTAPPAPSQRTAWVYLIIPADF